MNRLHKGSDGKVPLERLRGKSVTVKGLEFGEKVLYRLKPKSTQEGSFLEKLNKRFDFGIFVGVRRVSREAVIATKRRNSVRKVR